MPKFKIENPIANDAEGVYRIYVKPADGDELTLYIGRSNNLSRRISDYENPKIARTNNTSSNTSKLDTRVIIYAMLDFLNDKKIDCCFEHLDWINSNEIEKRWAAELPSLLLRLDSNNTYLKEQYYLEEIKDYWNQSIEKKE